MEVSELKQLEVLIHSPGWLTLKNVMQEELASLTERICLPETDWDTTVQLRAERIAIEKVMEQPALILQQFQTSGE